MTYVLLGILALVRADAAVLACLLAAYSLFLNPKKRGVLARISIVILFPMLHLVFRQWYYGEDLNKLGLTGEMTIWNLKKWKRSATEVLEY